MMPPESRAIRGVDDSKELDGARREQLAGRIRERAMAIGIGAASVREIDRLNIYHAAVLAIRRSISRLPVRPDHVVVDGNPIRSLGVEHTAVVGGDGCCHSIACASIVAKVTRDRLMRALARRHPHYRWETNVGYGTADHHAGLASHGITPHHRRSFTPVQLALALSVAPEEEAPDLAQALHDILVPDRLVPDTLVPDALVPDALVPDTGLPLEQPPSLS
jgi:ribonuclease HII